MSRGDRREDIFHDDVDRQSRGRGTKTLAEASQEAGFQVHACCLMPHQNPRPKPGQHACAMDRGDILPFVFDFAKLDLCRGGSTLPGSIDGIRPICSTFGTLPLLPMSTTARRHWSIAF